MARVRSAEYLRRKYRKRYKKKDAQKRLRDLYSEGTVTVTELSQLLIDCDFKCVYCGKDITQERHLDHIIPVSRGGSNWIENFQFLCPSCNMAKTNMLPWHYEASIRYDRNTLYYCKRKLYRNEGIFNYFLRMLTTGRFANFFKGNRKGNCLNPSGTF